MDERDLLVSDVRVSVLGDEGQYVFEWTDNTQESVQFLADESNYDSVSEEVIELLNSQGIALATDDTGESTDSVSTAGPYEVSLTMKVMDDLQKSQTIRNELPEDEDVTDAAQEINGVVVTYHIEQDGTTHLKSVEDLTTGETLQGDTE